MRLNLPNTITILRIFAVPLVVWLILSGLHAWAFWVFLAAGISDGIDGYLARAWNQRTELGAYLDPVADKALLVSIYVTLAIAKSIPVWLTIAVVFRDVMIVGAIILSWGLNHPLVIRPLMVSKLNTVAQIAFAAVALGGIGFGLQFNGWFVAGGWIVGGLTLVSAAAYLAQWTQHMAMPGERT